MTIGWKVAILGAMAGKIPTTHSIFQAPITASTDIVNDDYDNNDGDGAGDDDDDDIR